MSPKNAGQIGLGPRRPRVNRASCFQTENEAIAFPLRVLERRRRSCRLRSASRRAALECSNSNLADEWILVRRCGLFNCLPGTGVPVRQPQEYRYCSVSNVGTGIRRNDSAQDRHDIGDAEFHRTTLFTGQPMERQLPHWRDGVIERRQERVCGRVVGIVVQEERARSPYPRIRMLDRRDLHIGEGNLVGQAMSLRVRLVAQRLPTVKKVVDPFQLAIGRHSSIEARRPGTIRCGLSRHRKGQVKF